MVEIPFAQCYQIMEDLCGQLLSRNLMGNLSVADRDEQNSSTFMKTLLICHGLQWLCSRFKASQTPFLSYNNPLLFTIGWDHNRLMLSLDGTEKKYFGIFRLV